MISMISSSLPGRLQSESAWHGGGCRRRAADNRAPDLVEAGPAGDVKPVRLFTGPGRRRLINY